MGRRLAECGTISAAQRHQKRGQVCQVCRDAENAYRRAKYAERKARKQAEKLAAELEAL